MSELIETARSCQHWLYCRYPLQTSSPGACDWNICIRSSPSLPTLMSRRWNTSRRSSLQISSTQQSHPVSWWRTSCCRSTTRRPLWRHAAGVIAPSSDDSIMPPSSASGAAPKDGTGKWHRRLLQVPCFVLLGLCFVHVYYRQMFADGTLKKVKRKFASTHGFRWMSLRNRMRLWSLQPLTVGKRQVPVGVCRWQTFDMIVGFKRSQQIRAMTSFVNRRTSDNSSSELVDEEGVIVSTAGWSLM